MAVCGLLLQDLHEYFRFFACERVATAVKINAQPLVLKLHKLKLSSLYLTEYFNELKMLNTLPLKVKTNICGEIKNREKYVGKHLQVTKLSIASSRLQQLQSSYTNIVNMLIKNGTKRMKKMHSFAINICQFLRYIVLQTTLNISSIK